MSKQSKKKKSSNTIADNRKARYEYHIHKQIEAGLVLEGWEVKSIRGGKGQITESYITIKKGEAWLINAHIMPLKTVSTHITADPKRERKCLLSNKELIELKKSREAQGYTIVPLNLHWKNNRVKLQIAIAKGKKLYDKRETIKKRDLDKQKRRSVG